MFKKSNYNFKSCNELPLEIDISRLRDEFEIEVKSNFESYKSSNQKRSGWERYILFSHPNFFSEVEEASPEGFERLEYINQILSSYLNNCELVNAMFAIIPPKSAIGLHIDGQSKNQELHKKIDSTIRFHIPIYTNQNVLMFIGDKFFQMKAGEFWMLNNHHWHGVINTDDGLYRNHLIFDVIPSEELIESLLKMEEAKGFTSAKNLKLLLNQSAEKKAQEFKSNLPLSQRIKLAVC